VVKSAIHILHIVLIERYGLYQIKVALSLQIN